MVEKSNIDMLNRKIYNYLRNFFETEKKLFSFLVLARLVRLLLLLN